MVKMEKDKRLGLRIDSETHYKVQCLSRYEGRSIDGEVLYLIRKEIELYDKEHGKSNRNKKPTIHIKHEWSVYIYHVPERTQRILPGKIAVLKVLCVRLE